MDSDTLSNFTDHKRAICTFLFNEMEGPRGPPRTVQVTEQTYISKVREVIKINQKNKKGKGSKEVLVYTGKKDGKDRAWFVGEDDGLFHMRDEPHSILVPDTAIQMMTYGDTEAVIEPVSNLAMAQERARKEGRSHTIEWKHYSDGSLAGAQVGNEFVPADAM